MKEQFESKKLEEIYLKLLTYGNECFHCGITFEEVKQRLISDTLFQEGQSLDIFRQLFIFSYDDYSSTCKNPISDKDNCNCEEDTFDHFTNCPHYLSKEGCLNLIELSDSFLNQSSAKKNLESAKISKNLGIIAICIASVSLISPIIDIVNYFGKKDKSELLELKQLNSQLKEVNKRLLLDSLNRLNVPPKLNKP